MYLVQVKGEDGRRRNHLGRRRGGDGHEEENKLFDTDISQARRGDQVRWLTIATAPPFPSNATTPAGAARPASISPLVKPPGYGKVGS